MTNPVNTSHDSEHPNESTLDQRVEAILQQERQLLFQSQSISVQQLDEANAHLQHHTFQTHQLSIEPHMPWQVQAKAWNRHIPWPRIKQVSILATSMFVVVWLLSLLISFWTITDPLQWNEPNHLHVHATMSKESFPIVDAPDVEMIQVTTVWNANRSIKADARNVYVMTDQKRMYFPIQLNEQHIALDRGHKQQITLMFQLPKQEKASIIRWSYVLSDTNERFENETVLK